MSRRHPRSDFGDTIANWRRSELPLLERTRLALRNTWIKVRRLEGCCGNYGEPGC